MVAAHAEQEEHCGIALSFILMFADITCYYAFDHEIIIVHMM
jgi:hypothetical protein